MHRLVCDRFLAVGSRCQELTLTGCDVSLHQLARHRQRSVGHNLESYELELLTLVCIRAFRYNGTPSLYRLGANLNAGHIQVR